MELSGRVAVVTGGARGIGRGIAVALARRGAHVVVADLLADPDIAREAEVTLAGAAAAGVQTLAVACDVRDAGQVDALAAAVLDRFGRVDIGCANAGVIRASPLAEGPVSDWELVVDVNLTGTFLLARALAPHLIAQRSGALVVVSSVAAFRGGAGYAAYCASKAGLIGLTRAIATELAPYNVRANAICPGYLATTMWYADILAGVGEADREAEFRSVVAGAVPLGRPQTPEDIGQAAVYLCEADNVTGVALTVDGGHIAGP